MEEKMSIVLEAQISKFKSTMDKASNILKDFSKKAKEGYDIGVKLDAEEAEEELDFLKEKIQETARKAKDQFAQIGKMKIDLQNAKIDLRSAKTDTNAGMASGLIRIAETEEKIQRLDGEIKQLDEQFGKSQQEIKSYVSEYKVLQDQLEKSQSLFATIGNGINTLSKIPKASLESFKSMFESKGAENQLKTIEDFVEESKAYRNEYEKNLAITSLKSAKAQMEKESGYKFKDDEEFLRTLKQIREEQEQINNNSKKSNNIGNMFKKATTSLKRFALSLFGIRGMFSIVSKAMNAYLSDNKKLQNSIKGIWNGLGTLMGPILDVVANLVLKLLGYINVITKALWNFDFVAEANKKTMEKYRKELAKTNKALGSFDELSNLQQHEDEGPQGLIDIPELDPKIVKTLEDLAKKLKPIADTIGKIVGFCTDHPEVILGLLGAVAVTKAIGKILGTGTIGAIGGTGLLGLACTLGWIAGLGALAVEIYIAYKYTKEAVEATTENKQAIENNTQGKKEVTDKIVNHNEEIQQYEKGTQAINQYVGALQSEIENNSKLIKSNNDWEKSLSLGQKLLYQATGKLFEKQYQSKVYAQNIDALVKEYGELYKAGKLTNSQTAYYFTLLDKMKQNSSYDSLFNFDEEATKLEKVLPNLESKVDDVKKTIGNMTSDSSNALKINIDTSELDDLPSALQTALNKVKTFFGLPENKLKPQINNENINKIKTSVQNQITKIKEFLSNDKNKVKPKINNENINKIKTSVQDKINSIKTLLGQDKNKIKPKVNEDNIKKLPNDTKTKIDEANNKAKNNPISLFLKPQIEQPNQNDINKMVNNVVDNFKIILKGLGIFVPGLAIGTDRVNKEGLAYLHKGESVVPADVVSGGYTGGNNEETNELLRELITTLDEKQFSATISTNDVGRASVNYIRNQNRIMGGSVI